MSLVDCVFFDKCESHFVQQKVKVVQCVSALGLSQVRAEEGVSGVHFFGDLVCEEDGTESC